MKNKLYRASALLLCSLVVSCKNPWMEKILDPLFAKNFEYKIGDRGPGGRIIFYYDPKGFTMTDNGQICHYLEAAPPLWDPSSSTVDPKKEWAEHDSSSPYTDFPGANGLSIGTGKKNTQEIKNVSLNNEDKAPAAFACIKYTGGGKNDWFLPSPDELKELYEQRSVVDMDLTTYWSSWQSSITAHCLDFSTGLPPVPPLIQNKDSFYCVRPIRAF
ncbi:MAG: DUF1566 domain-containing protein [Treponema sp.]|jgi:hypothetical protein|nr:DUF1566 domain-containing protein [Treponema sp.]